MDEPQFGPDAERVIKSKAQDEPQNEPQIQSDETTYQRCRVLLETIISKPYLTKEDLGKQLGVSESTIKRDIDKLRKTYRITWIGPTIGGRWGYQLFTIPPVPDSTREQGISHTKGIFGCGTRGGGCGVSGPS